MAPGTNLPIRYWLRSVRIGLLVTVLVIAIPALLPFLPHHTEIRPIPYAAILLVGVDGAALMVRLSVLGILTILTSFLSRELMAQVSAQERSRTNAERWAALLSTVAESAHSMTLDPERVFEVALDSILGLGFQRGALCLLDEDGRTYRVLQAHGLPPDV